MMRSLKNVGLALGMATLLVGLTACGGAKTEAPAPTESTAPAAEGTTAPAGDAMSAPAAGTAAPADATKPAEGAMKEGGETKAEEKKEDKKEGAAAPAGDAMSAPAPTEEKKP